MSTKTFVIFFCIFGIIAVSLFHSCSDNTRSVEDNVIQPQGTSGLTSSEVKGMLKQLVFMDISLDYSEFEETESMPDVDDEFYDDYIENDFIEQYVVYINYNGNSASLSGDIDAITVITGENPSDVIINSNVKGVHYVLTGNTDDGSFKIYSEKKFELELNGVNITNPTGAAINNQGKRAFIVLADETENTLADGQDYTDVVEGEDMKGVFFSEGKMAFSGTGKLTVNSKGKNGIVSDDYILFRPGVKISVNSSSGHCVKTNDGIIVRGGVLNCTTSAAATKGFKTDGMFLMQGGRVTAITSGNGEFDSDDNDVNCASGVKADSIIVVSGGELYCMSTGKGGKGISTDKSLTVNGGRVFVATYGQTCAYNGKLDSKSKGIKADGNVLIEGGDIMVKAMGDENSEGFESKGTFTQKGGKVGAYSYDDGVNSKSSMVIYDGVLYGYSIKNDGIDSNGDLVVNGGLVAGCGSSAPEEGIDTAEGHLFIINGGNVVGIGGHGEAMGGTQQKASITGVSVTGGNYVAVSQENEFLYALQAPCSYNNATLQVSSPFFKSGITYTLVVVDNENISGEDVFGFVASPNVEKSSSYGTFLTTTTTTGGMSGNMGGDIPHGGGGPHHTP